MDLTTESCVRRSIAKAWYEKVLCELDRVAGRDQHVEHVRGLVTPHR